MSTPVTPALITQLLDLAGQLDAERALAELVVAAADHTGARYAAIAELDAYGETTTFIQQGMSAEEVAVLGHPPRGHGVLGTLPEGVLLLDDLTQHPAFEGFPPGHPPMHTFLGVPVMAGGIVLGRLYLTNKPSGFTPQDVETVTLLAAAAAVAMDNARLYRQAQDRERWMQVSQEITAALLEGTEEEDVLALIAQRIREVADADGAAIVLPSLDEEWMVEIVDGPRMAPLIGAVLPPDGPAIESVHTASGVLVDSIARDADRFIPEARIFERALYAPLLTHLADDDAGAGATTSSLGVLILFRLPGRPAFTEQDLAVAADFGRQAALALRLAAARHAEDIAALLNERSRIARDLHDLAIQQLFATGMRL
ncbi:MAG: GAF domain-containing protein, partial [Salana multivorans]|nr:GAF domain-containing protein [Salana multivorans]